MKLNIDCMRDVLKKAEEMPYNCMIKVSDLCKELTDYSDEDIRYSCMKLYESSMILASVVDVDNAPLFRVIAIYDITYKGHEFLAKVRDDERWHGIKKALPAIRDYSIDAINAVANGFASAAITAYFSRQEQ